MGQLQTMFNPSTVALIGASEKEGTVGRTIFENLLRAKERRTYPIHPSAESVLGQKSYPHISSVTEHVDLAIIATPAATVPALVEECGQAGVDGVVIVSAGFKEIGKEGEKLGRKIGEIGKKYRMRILGPNSVGFVKPAINLNATFIKNTPPPGHVAFISQSAALGNAILNWAADAGIGFSMFASLSDMVDIDFADMIDFLEEYDEATKSILVYMESVGNARKFMSAARGFARRKPIIVLKPGKHIERADVARSHLWSMIGDSAVYGAAFRRAGVLRVKRIAELFDAAAVLVSEKFSQGPRVAVIGAAGPCLVITDALIKRGGELADLSPESMKQLDAVMPPYWNRANPVYLHGAATVEQYAKALEIFVQDASVDGVLVYYDPLNNAPPDQVAQALVNVAKKTRKPIIAAWMGGKAVKEGKRILTRNSIMVYNTPEEAVGSYMNMYNYKKYIDRLYETPAALPEHEAPPKDCLKALIRTALAEGRTQLNEQEAKEFLAAYGIPVAMPEIARTPEEATAIAEELGYPVAIKIVSPDISSKSEVEGVILGITSSEELQGAYAKLMQKMKKNAPQAAIVGVAVETMMTGVNCEILLGTRKDKDFGSFIFFGTGGMMTEAIKDYSIGLPPLNKTLAAMLMQDSMVYKMLKASPGKPAVDFTELEEILVNFSNLIVDFPEIAEIVINPLAIAHGKVSALDARITIDKYYVPGGPSAHPHLVISPYPTKYVTTWLMPSGTEVILRPIRPEDEPAKKEMLFSSSPESLRTRYFSTMKDIPHEFLIYFVNVDYDRHMSLVAEVTEKGKKKMIGAASLVMNPEMTSSEIAVFVHDSFQGKGLGTRLLQVLIDIARERSLQEVRAEVLSENTPMLAIFRRLGFTTRFLPGGTSECVLKLLDQ
jgi:acetyltransferase